MSRPGKSKGKTLKESLDIEMSSLKQEHKKRKRSNEASSSNEPSIPVPISHPVAKKRPQKKKSKKKKSEPVMQQEDDSSPLEGTMIGDQMVLIDRMNTGIVYAAAERLEDGTRKPIGKVLSDGTIQIDTNEGVTRTNDDPFQFPYEADPDDHCESPMDAYQDIVPFLNEYKKKKADLSIYDPFYCNGAVRRNLESLGFPNVYHRKEDCYEVWNTPSRYPNHDILITNPPYSGDHLEKLIRHITSPTYGNRPWMLLLPQWVHKKDYYIHATRSIQPFYLVPHKRYVYLPPPSFRQSKKSDVHKKSSPFVSMWYLWGGSQNEQWLSITRNIRNCDMARSKSALRDLRRKGK